jgi:hypothetical protein
MMHTLWQQIKKKDKDWSREEVEVKEVLVMVKAIPRFRDDVNTLACLMMTEKSPLK